MPRKNFIAAIIFILCCSVVSSCGNAPGRPAMLVLSGVTMGTYYQIKVNSPKAEQARGKIQLGVAAILDHIDKSMSTYNPESELSKINQNRTLSWQPLSRDLYRVLDDAIRISELTHGAFDITVGPLVNLWGFGPGPRSGTIPSAEEIRSRLARTGYHNLVLRSNPMSISKKIPGMYLDLSGIAKGYGVDKIAEYLESMSFRNYLVDIGGEVRVRGINAEGKLWNIGIERPIAGQRSVQRVVPLRDVGMATSGDYRNFFIVDGKRYSHTIDPKTGWPITHKLDSVTVLNPSTAIADALATGLLVLGPSRAYELAQKHGIAAYLIMHNDHGFQERETPAFTAMIGEWKMENGK